MTLSPETKKTNENDPILCPCSGTKCSLVRTLFEQGMDLEAISRYTGALTGCGGCEWEMAEYLKQLPK